MLRLHSCNGITEEEGTSHRLLSQYIQWSFQYYVTTAPTVKGVTHCLLPECNSPVWPFMNYCGRTHADLGKQRGLQRKYYCLAMDIIILLLAC